MTQDITPQELAEELARQEASERLRSAYMKVQQAKRGKPMREGPLKLLWDVINAVPAALYHLDKMPEFEADLAAEEALASEAQPAQPALREAFLETREFLGLLEEAVCDWSCPTQWKTDDGQPHSKLHEDLKAVLSKHEATRDAVLRTQEQSR